MKSHLASRNVQAEKKRVKSAPGTVFAGGPFVLAASDRKRLFRGLERLVNTGDSLGDYEALAKAWPMLWPVSLESARGSLAWKPECHKLFLVYRNLLRWLWGFGPPEVVHCDDEAAKTPEETPFPEQAALDLLLGIDKPPAPDTPYMDWWIDHAVPEMAEAVEQIARAYPDCQPLDLAGVYASWKRGQFFYAPMNDFQRAFYALFRESWRAKVCPHCSLYFIAGKPSQVYCGVECSNTAHRANALKWWKRVGAKRRAKASAEKEGRG